MRSRIPKVLHPICGRPMLDYVLDAVAEAGAKDIKVIVNPHHAEVAAHLDERGIAPTFQREPKGTAHALQQVPENELKGKEVLVVNGDSPLLTGATIQRVLEAHRAGKTPVVLDHECLDPFFGEILSHRGLHIVTPAPPAQDLWCRADPGQLRDVCGTGRSQLHMHALERRHDQRYILTAVQIGE